MAAVLSEVDGDAVGAGEFTLDGCPDGVRFVGEACLADGGDVIYVYVEYCHFLSKVEVVILRRL